MNTILKDLESVVESLKDMDLVQTITCRPEFLAVLRREFPEAPKDSFVGASLIEGIEVISGNDEFCRELALWINQTINGCTIVKTTYKTPVRKDWMPSIVAIARYTSGKLVAYNKLKGLEECKTFQ